MIQVTLMVVNPVFGAQQITNNDAIAIIEKGMNDDYVEIIPIGKIVIGSNIMTQQDPKNHVYNSKFRNILLGYNKIGIVLVDEIKDMSMSSALGEKKYNVNITDKGKNNALGTNGQGDYLFRWANVKISKIVKNSEFKPAFDYYPAGKIDRSADYRLVLGIYDLKYTDTQNEIHAALGLKVPKSKALKFKALLQYDPFKEKYKYVQKDWGNLDKDDWVTNTIK